MGICFLCFWGALGDAVHGELVIEVFSCWKGLYERHINTWEAQEQRNCQLNKRTGVGYVSNTDTNVSGTYSAGENHFLNSDMPPTRL